MNEHIWWYVARASGMVAWLLLTFAVTWGVWLSTRESGSTPRPAWLLDLHRWLGGLAVTFTGMHVLGILLDGYVQFSLPEVLIPFAAHWHPAAVAWGVVALYGLVAVQVSSLMMRRMRRSAWHTIHLTSYVLFWMASIHALSSGTDSGSVIVVVITLVGMTVVAVGTVKRLRISKEARQLASTSR